MEIRRSIMTIRQQGGIFGRNPTFNDLGVEGSANLGSNVDINGGAIDGTAIGASSAAAATFTSAKVIGSNTGAAVDVPNALVVQNTAGSGFGQGAPVKFFHGVGSTDTNYTAALIGEYGTWSPTNGLGGGLAIYTKNSSVENKPSKKAEFTFTGNLSFNSGLGIDFSATDGTGTSELFDDYEEGTWTPTVTSGAGTVTLVDATNNFYTKIGRTVQVFSRIGISTNASVGTSDLTIGGLPYAVTDVGTGNLVNTNYSAGDWGTGGAHGLVFATSSSISHVARTVDISSRATFYWSYYAIYTAS
jgi:hypothetical protein